MTLTRKELYNLVWSEPMSSVCKRFGLSDNGLRKHCVSMNIPTPPKGYWAKLQNRKKVEKVPLPNDYQGGKQSVNLNEVDPKDVKTDHNLPVSKQKMREKEISTGDISIFRVPDVLYAKESIIIDTKEKQDPNSENPKDYKNTIFCRELHFNIFCRDGTAHY